jgi:cell wall-associated NlpC family hydrolase
MTSAAVTISRYVVVMALLAIALFASACASSGANRPRPFPSPAGSTAPATSTPEPAPAAPPPAAPRSAIPNDQALVATALSFRGTPYRNGGSDPSGFDCSGFTQWVFAQYGIALPRNVEEQFKVGEKIKQDDLKPGDLVFFHTESRGASHVGIFIADDQFVHAPSSKGLVRVEYINSTYWGRRFVGARRMSLEPEQQPEVATTRPRPFPGAPTTGTSRPSTARGD